MKRKEIKRQYKEKQRELKAEYVRQKGRMRDAMYYDLDRNTEEKSERIPINPPHRAPLEEIGNSVTHLVGALLAAVALVLMLINAVGVREFVGAAIYSFGLITMFTMSCLYHAFPPGSRVKRIFRRFDYSSIYLLIGATFAPILLCYVGGTFGLVYLIVQWVIIATGITFIAVFGPTRLKILHTSLYLLLGWVGLMFLPLMISNGDLGFLFYILGGGVVYSLGIIPFLLKGNVAHFIWHFFVLGGAVVQWVGVYLTIYLNM